MSDDFERIKILFAQKDRFSVIIITIIIRIRIIIIRIRIAGSRETSSVAPHLPVSDKSEINSF